MKKTLLLITACLFVLAQSFGQNEIPNASFENWETVSGKLNPVDWTTTNTLYGPFVSATVIQDTDAFEGDYCVKLETQSFGFFALPAMMTLGTIDTSTAEVFIGGVPFTEKAKSLTFSYQCDPQDGDTSGMIIYFYKYNETTGTKDTVLAADFMEWELVKEWKTVTIPIEELIPFMAPDTMNLVVISSASYNNMTAGTSFTLDDMSLELSSGIAYDLFPDIRVSVYPNPAAENLSFDFGEQIHEGELVIYNSNGSKVSTHTVTNNIETLNVSKLSQGVYYYHLLKSNKRLSSGSFVIE